MKTKYLLKPTVALFVICLIASFLLAGTNAITKDRIAQTQAEAAEASRRIVFAQASSFGEETTIDVEGNPVSCIAALDEKGEAIGYVFTAANRGYGGKVKVMTGVDLNGAVTRIVILSMDKETPGLGQNAAKETFWSQFSGQTGPFALTKNGGGIQGVTSASRTSNAVVNSVNDALSAFQSLKEAEK